MQANTKTLKEFFTENRIFEIPFFQRRYTWNKREWGRFMEDMICVSQPGHRTSYFLGSIILKQISTDVGERSKTRWMIIDGQQRMMTLCLFFKALWLLSPNSKDTFLPYLQDVLAPSLKDKAVFDDIMSLERDWEKTEVAEDEENSESSDEQSDDTVEAEKKVWDPKGRLGEAFHFIYHHLKAEFENIVPEKIIDTITFVGIDLDGDENEQQIFDVINSRGVTLTVAELLKNRLFTPDDKEDYEKNWKEVFERDEETWNYWGQEIIAGNAKRQLIELFLYSFLQIKVHAPKTAISPEDRKNFSKVEELFDSYKCYIDRYLKSEVGNKKSFIKEIKDHAEIFREFFDTKTSASAMLKNDGKARINTLIFGLGNTPLIPYVLYVLKNVNNESERSGIFAYLESYVMRRVVAKKSNKNYNRLFGELLITHRAITKEKLAGYIRTKQKGEGAMPDDNELLAGFHNTPLNNRQSRGVLYFIESYHRTSFFAMDLKGLSKYSLEHIMPKKWEQHWNWPKLKPEEAKERTRRLKTLGNLAIVAKNLNPSLKNQSWKKKRTKLKEYAAGLVTIGKIFDLPQWGESQIKKRARFLFAKAKKCWEM